MKEILFQFGIDEHGELEIDLLPDDLEADTSIYLSGISLLTIYNLIAGKDVKKSPFSNPKFERDINIVLDKMKKAIDEKADRRKSNLT